MKENSDFFGEYVAPGAFYTGAGITAYRAFSEMGRRGTLTNRWEAQKAQGQFFQQLERSRENRFRRSHQDIMEAFFLPQSRFAKGQHVGFDTPQMNTAFNRIRGMATANLIHQFGLSDQARGFGITSDPASITQSRLKSLLDISPKHYQFMERSASSFGLLALVNVPGSAKGIQAAASQRAATARQQILRNAFAFDPSMSVKGFIESNPKLRSTLSPVHHFRESADILSEKQLRGLLTNLARDDAEDLISRTVSLHSRIADTKDLRMKLLYLRENGKEFISGVRIIGNKKIGPIDAPFVQPDGTVRMGYFGRERGIARMVTDGEIHRFMEGGQGKISRKLDIALLEHLEQQIGSYTASGGRNYYSFLRGIKGNFRDEANKAIINWVENPTLRRKFASQVILKDIGFGGLSDAQIPAFDAEAIRRGMEVTTSLGPNQVVKGVRILSNRPFGAQSIGQAPGDPKTLSQFTRDTVFRTSPTEVVLQGMRQKQFGDVHGHIRSYAMPQAALQGMLGSSSRRDIGLHEDVAVLLDRNIQYSQHKITRIEGSSHLSSRMRDILGDAQGWYRPTLAAARSSLGVQGTLDLIDTRLNRLGQGPAFERLSRRRALISAGREFLSSDLAGFSSEGAVQSIGKQGRFLLDRIAYYGRKGRGLDTDTSSLVLEGVERRALKTGDKVFGWKRIFAGEMGAQEGRYMAALYEATRGRSDIAAAVAAEDTGALRDIYRPHMERFKSIFSGSKGGAGLAGIVPEGVSAAVWEQALHTVGNVQALESQGIKKIGERNIDIAVHGLFSEVAREHAATQSVYDEMREAYALTRAEPAGSAAVIRRKRELDSVLANLGITRQGGEYFVDDAARVAADDPRNIINRMGAVLSETMDWEGNLSGVRRWKAERVFADLATAESLTAHERTKVAKWAAQSPAQQARIAGAILRNGDSAYRSAMIGALQDQLQYGAYSRALTIGGDSRLTGGSGRQGSFNVQMMRHLQAQGGVSADFALEFAGRIQGDKADEVLDVYRRLGAFYDGGLGNAVSLSDFGAKYGPNAGLIPELFGRNQEVRSAAFAEVRRAFGLEASGGLLLDIGDGRQIFHPEAISSHTGAFMDQSGVASTSDIDVALKNVISAGRTGQAEALAEAVGGYEEAMKRIAVGKNQAPIAMMSGKIQGSLRGQARPQVSDELLDFIQSNYANAVGVRESTFKRMLADMGAVDDIDSRIGLLRAGEEAAYLARQPGTEMHRISGVKLFSVDEMLEQWTARQTAGMSVGQLQDELRLFDQDRYNSTMRKVGRMHRDAREAQRVMGLASDQVASALDRVDAAIAEAEAFKMKDQVRGSNRVAALEAAKGRILSGDVTPGDRRRWGFDAVASASDASVRSQWMGALSEARTSAYDDNALWVAKHMEMILGADYDDDQLDLILGKSRHLNEKLRQRVSHHTALWEGQYSIEEAKGLSNTPIERAAAEDYIYKLKQQELYGGLKKHSGGVISAAEVQHGTPEWATRQRGQALMAEFEKGYIGQMTNSTDFVREVLRTGGVDGAAEGRLFAEMLLGIMPEIALKARQAGAQELTRITDDRSIASSITSLNELLSGKKNRMTRQQMLDEFNASFRKVHGEGQLIDDLLKYSPDVIDAIRTSPADEQHNLLTRYFKRDPADVDMKQIWAGLMDPTVPWTQGEYARAAMTDMKAAKQFHPSKRHIKNIGATFGDAVQILKKHKKPMLYGTAGAIATSLLLASPGSISAEEADMAGARHHASDPSPDGPGFGPQAPVSIGQGKTIRVRGSASRELDHSRITAMLQDRFPGADATFTMNDYRERMNEEYLRKRLMRG